MRETWYKVDNVAKVFIATSTRRDPRVFRISCTLNEEVDPAALAAALERAVRQFQNFQVTLHRGLFWHYLESTDKMPHPEEETRAPCAEVYGADIKNELLYRVLYRGQRIHLEMFHGLSDGNGGILFLKTIVCYYLKARHPEELADAVPEYDASAADLAQDSFRKFYGRRKAPEAYKGGAYRLHGAKLPYDQTQYFEAHMPVAQLLAKAKECGATITSYLAALLMLAIYAEMPPLERNRPIVVSIPVNLRNYYPSATARNFFNTIKIGHRFTAEEEISLPALAATLDADLKAALTPENIKAQMDSYEKLEHMPGIKPVPLFIKNKAVGFFTWLETFKETVTLSNMGRIPLAPALANYVDGFSSVSSTNTMFICVCSYQEELVLGISSAFRNTNVLKNFIRGLSGNGLDVTIYATEVES
ncbi:MAG: hypothetical protein PHO10_04955 [Gemmiger sp.]|nr:hypothetical protein [Gemmiger sp.]